MSEREKFEGIPDQDQSASWGVRYERTISPDLLDKDNMHLGYLGFVKIFEEAQRAMQGERGLDYENLSERFGIRLFVKDLHIEYKGEVPADENVRIFTKVLMPGRTSVAYHQAMLNTSNEIVANSTFVLVGVDEEGKPKVLPGEVREGLTTLNIE